MAAETGGLKEHFYGILSARSSLQLSCPHVRWWIVDIYNITRRQSSRRSQVAQMRTYIHIKSSAIG